MKTVRRLIVRAIWMFNASTMLLSTGLLFALASVGLISGCVAGGTREAIGVEYPIEQVASVRPGMPEEEVIKLLGKP
jgi:outer membrane protein assembly factor BamE (lipoprotein component of BamABCDE complex)